ncbi:MAG: hypothetical protein ACLQNE_14705 [Thermoguttaceae bacterium]
MTTTVPGAPTVEDGCSNRRRAPWHSIVHSIAPDRLGEICSYTIFALSGKLGFLAISTPRNKASAEGRSAAGAAHAGDEPRMTIAATINIQIPPNKNVRATGTTLLPLRNPQLLRESRTI